MRSLLIDLRTSILLTLILAALCCGLYPAAVWGVARAVFPGRADGSLVEAGGGIVGSRLIGQGFASPAYFHPRPSAAGAGYDGSSSGGTNLGPLSGKLIEAVRRRASDFRRENGLAADAAVPADAVTASASGLDPHISPSNARLQAPRVARARGVGPDVVLGLIGLFTKGRTFGLLGEPRVNVLEINLELDRRFGKAGTP